MNNQKHNSKRYKEYLLDCAEHNQSIMKHYGMPPEAKPPLTKDNLLHSDIQFRKSHSRTQFMKKGSSFNAVKFKV